VTGAEIGGAIKNVLAIGCGVVEGAGLGPSVTAVGKPAATSCAKVGPDNTAIGACG
jgi:hypothetical protein